MSQRIIHVLKATSKPYNAKGLAESLNSADAVITSLMPALIKSGQVKQKDFGKTDKTSKVLFYYNDNFKEPGGIPDFHNTTTRLRDLEQIHALELKEISNLEAQVSSELTALTNEQLIREMNDLEKQLNILQQRRNDANSAAAAAGGGGGGASKIGFKKVDNISRDAKELRTGIQFFDKEWGSRKKICMEFLDNVSDGMDKSVKEVVKIIGIDTDEAEGVVRPSVKEKLLADKKKILEKQG